LFPLLFRKIIFFIFAGKRFVLSVPPHVENSQDLATNGYFIKQGNETLIVELGNKEVALPDFGHSDITAWYAEKFKIFVDDQLGQVPARIHLIKDSPYAKLSSPCDLSALPFVPWTTTLNESIIIENATICPDSTQSGGDHFKLHNLYSRDHCNTLKESLKVSNKISDIFSKHSYPGKMEGLLGSDRTPTWENLGASLREVLELSLSGSGLVSMQACGIENQKPELFNETFSMDELCLRWYQLEAFMPAVHAIHETAGNSSMPYRFSKKTYTNWVKRALQRRIKLAPYIYSQMYLSYQDGEHSGSPLIRPLFYEFPDDLNLNNYFVIWKQFMLGDSILVNPVVDPEIRLVEAFFPREPWYELWSGLKIEGLSKMQKTEAIQAQIPAYIR
jgi:alpha-glucosidase (family GH31 glycosyl hydrolase)